MMQKNVLITGVTGTIGKATALEATATNARIGLLARNRLKLEAVRHEIIAATGNKDIDIFVADLSDVRSIKKAADEVKQKWQHLDALVNVAAVYRAQRETTPAGLEMMFATNHLGVFALTHELLDLLKNSRPARVVTVSAPSSTRINFDDLQGEKKFSAFNAFGASKMMNILFTYKLAEKLKDAGVSATVFHPGVVKSEIMSEMPGLLRFLFGLLATNPGKAAKALVKLALDPAYKDVTGKFFDFREKERKSAGHSYDKRIQDRLWEISEKLSAPTGEG
jgi:NAD(P)-dependent dehydrogenase (short-subunit alcohol dehydrogenase family)